MHPPLYATPSVRIVTLSAISSGWTVFWIVIAVIVLLLLAMALYRFIPELVRYMKIKSM